MGLGDFVKSALPYLPFPFGSIAGPLGAVAGSKIDGTLGDYLQGPAYALASGRQGAAGGKGDINFGQEATNILNEAKGAGLDDATASDLYNQYGIYLRSQLATTRGSDEEKPVRQGAYQKLANNIMTAMQFQNRQKQLGALGLGGVGGAGGMGGQSPMDFAAIQALSSAYMKPITEQSIAIAKNQESQLRAAASKVGGPYGEMLSAQAGAQSAAAQRTALAYAAQVQMAPQLQAFQQQQDMMKALASQLQSQAIASFLSGQKNNQPEYDWGGGLGGLSGILPGVGAQAGAKSGG